MNISIGYSRHKLLFSLILLLQLVYGGPQGLVVYQERVSQERVSPEGVGQEGVSQERVSGQEPVSGQEWVIGQNRGGRQEWIAAGPPDTYPGNPSPPNEQPPPYNGNLSMQPPPTYPSKCHVCTLSVSVSSDSILLFCNTLTSVIVSFALLLASRVDEYGLSGDDASSALSYISA